MTARHALHVAYRACVRNATVAANWLATAAALGFAAVAGVAAFGFWQLTT